MVQRHGLVDLEMIEILVYINIAYDDWRGKDESGGWRDFFLKIFLKNKKLSFTKKKKKRTNKKKEKIKLNKIYVHSIHRIHSSVVWINISDQF